MKQSSLLKIYCLWFVLSLISWGAVAASLEDFVDRTLTLSNEQLADALQIIRSAEAGVVNAQNALYPQVSLTFDYDVPYTSGASSGLALNGRYTLWDYGSRVARLDAERFEQERATLELEIEKNRLAYDVAGLYLDVFFLEQVLEILESTVLRVETLAPVLVRAENLPTLNIEELEARESYLGARNQVIALTNETDVIRRDLYRLVDLQDDHLPLDPVTLANLNAFIVPNGISELVAEHPLLLSTRVATRSTLASQRAEEANRLPELFLTTDVGLRTDIPLSASIGVGVSFDLDALPQVPVNGQSLIGVDRFRGDLSAGFPSYRGLDVAFRESAALQARDSVEVIQFNLQRDIENSYQGYLRSTEELELVDTQLRRFTLLVEDARRNGAPLIQQLGLEITKANLDIGHLLSLLNIERARLNFFSVAGIRLQEILIMP